MNRENVLRRTAGAAAATTILFAAGAARADGWVFRITPYMWATDVGVDATLGGKQIVDETIPAGDLVKKLDMIVQGRVEAQKGAFGAMVDVFDVTLSDAKSGVALPQGAGQADLSANMGMTIIDVEGIYDRGGDRQGLVAVYGTRILDERATVDATFHLATGSTETKRYETNDWIFDGLVGVRFSHWFTPHWGMQMQADASTGQTNYTWSVAPALGYAFGAHRQFGVNAGYRRMEINFKDDGDLETRMTLSGAVLGFRMSF